MMTHSTKPLAPRPRPVILTGYDVEIDCPGCNTRQLVGDDPDGTLETVTGDHISLHALPGSYLLIWRLTCWQCAHPFSGSLKILSRSAGHVPERRAAL